MKGIITNIQRFSLHDGEGIRTTVFFKGCNMRCLWCHNPETYDVKPQLKFIKAKCIGCMKCFEACKNDALTFENSERSYDVLKCTLCGMCVEACYPEANVFVGKNMTVQEVLDEVMIDFPYYENSGGGITISGGEPFVQAEFLMELLKKSKEQDLHVGIETNLSYDWNIIESILDYVDIVMLDIKSMDDELHKKMTGLSNKKVLENIKKLDKTGKDYIVRTPLIPGANYSYEDIMDIAGFLSGMSHILYYELLNYNILAQSKFQDLGLDYKLVESKPLSEEELRKLSDEIQCKYKGLKIKYQMG